MKSPTIEAAGPALNAITHGRPVRVVHVLPNLSTGGMERLLIEMLRHTDRSRVASRVLCIGAEGTLACEAVALGVPVDALNLATGRHPRLPFTLAAYFRRHEIDVIHTHGPYAHLYSALATRLAGRTPLVHTKHGFLWCPTRRRVLQNRLANRLSSRVIAVSGDLRDRSQSSERIASGKIQLVYNGIDTARFLPPRPVDTDRLSTIVMVARLSREKDFESLFRAMLLLKQRNLKCRLKVVGDGELRDELPKWRDDLGITDVVNLLGNREDIDVLLAEARVFVLSTNTEGLSISLLEAMAASLPVVATAVGGNPEVVVDGQTGFLVPPKSPGVLADKLAWLIEHPSEAAAMGRAGRERVERHFDVRQTVREYEQIYLDLAPQARSDGGRSRRAQDGGRN